jgi:hypothetical protein
MLGSQESEDRSQGDFGAGLLAPIFLGGTDQLVNDTLMGIA